MTVGGTKLIVAQTESALVAVNAADGKLAWESGGAAPGGGGMRGGGGRDYKAATPIVDGDVVITAGRGVTAVRLVKEGGKFVGKEVWANPDKSIGFNTPVLKNGMLFGLSGGDEVFCLSAKDGKTLWSAPLNAAPPSGAQASLEVAPGGSSFFGQAAPGAPGGGRRGGGQGGGRGGRGGMGGGGGYGSIVDAGSVLFVLTPASQLAVFEPSDKGFNKLASYKVAPGQTHAYPVVSGNRIFIKDRDSVILWTVD
jgi:outer membrane protein assembly factor BamB